MKTVFLITDVFDPATISVHQTEDVRQFLRGQFAEFPANARIYHKQVAVANDVTPSDELEIARLGELEGPFFVACYPGNPLEVVAIVALVISIALTAYTLLSIPNAARKNQQTPAPSNTLSDRTNEARVKARIPDIFGEVRSTPDLIQVPYRIFNTDSEELELSYMCISRGTLDVSADAVFDGDTLISAIGGESAEIYGPNTSPNSGTAQLTIGDAIGIGIISVQKSNSVNGQTLFAPNYKRIGTECSNIYFQYTSPGPNGIAFMNGGSYDFTKYFEAGDIVSVTTGDYTESSVTANLTGVYTVVSVTSDTLTFSDPASVNSDWTKLDGFSGHHTVAESGPVLDGYNVDADTGESASKWVGPFVLNDPDLTGLISNFVALDGLYKTNGTESLPFPVTIQIGVTAVDASGATTGSETTTDFTLPASGVDLSQKALSAISSISGRVSVRVKRTTDSDYTYQGTVADTVQWRDLYGTTPVSQDDFGNVTTIQTATRVTPASLGIKERKINLICTRKVPVRTHGATFGGLTATKKADAILCAIALDEYIGNRVAAELDVDNIYDTVAAIVDYFGIDEAAEFSYTFDNNQMSYEETVLTIATSIFCTAYREGNVLKLAFEKETDDSLLLFNHRNIIPDSETRNVRFGLLDGADGVEYTYVNPDDETVATIYIPSDQSAIKPQTIESVGVRSEKQAYLQAYRAYNKLLYQNTNTEFTGTRETDVIIPSNRILVADTTRSDTQAGEVMAQSGLVLTLSQPFTYESLDHSIFLQLYDGTVQSISIASAGTSPTNTVTLSEAPTLALQMDDGLYARTTYQIVGSSPARSSAFLVSTKTPQDNTTAQVTAINYDSRYYQNDLDFA